MNCKIQDKNAAIQTKQGGEKHLILVPNYLYKGQYWSAVTGSSRY